MPATLKGVSLISLDLGDQYPTNLIAVRVIISGRFSDVSNYATIMRKVFAENLNGAVFSSGVRMNFSFAPSDLEVSPLSQYAGLLQTTYGSDNGFKITTLRSTLPLKGTNQVNAVQSTSGGGLTYKGVRCCTVYNGGFAGHTNQICLNPVVIITDEDYNLYSQPSNSYMAGVVSEYATLGISEDDILPLPMISWHHDVYTDDMFNGIQASYINSISLSQHNIKDDIKNEYPVGPADPGDDPYGPGGYSDGDGGGTGDWDYEGDPQPFGGFPSGLPDAIDTGFFTLYTPTIAEMQKLSGYLWSDQFDLNLFKKLFNNPMDLFLNLGIVPVDVPAGPQKEVGIGLISTGIYMTKAAQRYISKNMGTVQVTMTHYSYIDFAPYVRADMILPYIGVVPMDIDAIMGRTIEVIYNVDILSGVCVAGINVIRSNGKHCIGTYAGNAMMSIPLTGSDYSTILSGLIQTAGAIAAGAASGGAAGAVAGGLAASSSAVVNEGKPLIQRGGALSANAGFFITQQKPVLIVSIPRECVPYTQLTELGYPCYRSTSVTDQWGNTTLLTIGNESGFIKVASIHLQNIPATDEELAEIESLLKEGVYV